MAQNKDKQKAVVDVSVFTDQTDPQQMFKCGVLKSKRETTNFVRYHIIIKFQYLGNKGITSACHPAPVYSASISP